MDMYMANGVSIGVLIDPASRTASIYRRGQPVECRKDMVPLDRELPGFALDLNPVFED